MSGDAWRRDVRRALDATGRAYVAVFIDSETHRAVTMATLGLPQVPEVLRAIAADVESGELKINAAEKEAAKA